MTGVIKSWRLFIVVMGEHNDPAKCRSDGGRVGGGGELRVTNILKILYKLEIK